MNRILVAEDEHAIRSFILVNLKRAGFEVVEATNGREAVTLFDRGERFDIVLLDVMMPEMDGFEACAAIRSLDENVGIIMLTARTLEDDKIEGLDRGADDYMAKPFSPGELVARIKALLRRVEKVQRTSGRRLKSGPFAIDLAAKQVTKYGVTIDLTPTEYDLICHLIQNEDVVLSRDALLDAVWGVNYFGDRKTVDVNIRRLRQKIEDDPSRPLFIETLWGHGYKWRRYDE